MDMEGADRSKTFSLLFAAAGFGSMFIVNTALKRPAGASIYKHFIAAGLGWAIGDQVEKFQAKRQRFHAIVLQDYINRHPDDFVAPDRKHIKDLLVPWNPVR